MLYYILYNILYYTVYQDITLTDSERLLLSILKDNGRYSVFPLFLRIMVSMFDEFNSPVYQIKCARGKGA